MESNWRMNTWLHGWTNSQFDMIARVLSGFYEGKYVGAPRDQVLVPIFEDTGDTQLLTFLGWVLPGGSTLHFPYGLDVSPD